MGQKGIGREAFAQADLEFHLAVARAAHNPFFVSISTLIEVVLAAMLTVSSPADEPDRLAASVVQHRRISKAIAERNADEARRSMREVIENGARAMPARRRTGSADYSRASACTGSSRAAERAGMKPKTTPIRLDEMIAAAIDSGRIGEPRAGQRTREAVAEREAQRDARRAAHDADQDRLGQELPHDVAAPRAHRHADADLAGPLADRHQHDVHHADAADDQRDDGDGRDQQGQRLARRLDRLADGVGVLEEEVLLAVEPGQQIGDLRLSRLHVGRIGHAHDDLAQIALAEDAVHRGGVGDIDVGVGAARAEGRCGRHDADHAHRHLADLDHLADGYLAVLEQRGDGVGIDHGDLRTIAHRGFVEVGSHRDGRAVDAEDIPFQRR